MRATDTENWTISRWRLEPRIHGLEFDDLTSGDQTPALWKDLTLASIVAVVLWTLAAMLLG
jgi:hypothetical protein